MTFQKESILTAKVYSVDFLPGEISLFPTEKGGGVVFSQEELFRLSALYADLYTQIINPIATALSHHYNLSLDVTKILAREAVVPLTHFFMDRLLRLEKLMRDCGDKKMRVANVPFGRIPHFIQEFENLATYSYEFNQATLCHLAPLYDLLLDSSPGFNVEKHPLSFTSWNNHNFDQSYKTKVRRAYYFGKSWFLSLIRGPKTGSIPVLGMGYATPFLQAEGFYGPGKFVELDQRIPIPSFKPNPELRQQLLSPALEEIGKGINIFLKRSGITEAEKCTKITNLYHHFFSQFYSPDLLEGIPSLLPRFLQKINQCQSKAIICADSGSTGTTYFLVAARLLGRQLVGYQQGGHEGYEDDYVQAGEAEYHYFDRYISWGWNRFPDRQEFKNIKMVLLPSPWLATRRRLWQQVFKKNGMVNIQARYDFILLPNKIYPYPPAPSGGNVSRIDHISTVVHLLKEFVSRARQEGFSVYHKPFNNQTVDLLADTMKELERIGGDHYDFNPNLAKGITPTLLQQCRLMIWDQPGTGFLECLVCEIPTMILWPRHYNREVSWARTIFSELEAVGVVHQTVDSLLNEYKIFRKAPGEWMQNPSRKDVIDRFCRQYAWTEEDWPRYWEQLFEFLS